MKFRKSLITTSLIFAISACGQKSSQEYIDSANSAAGKGDIDVAIIELKNALTDDLENAEIRFLLGNLYLQVGDLLPAEKELLKAITHGKSFTEVRPLLAKVYYLQNKHLDVTFLEDEEPLDYTQEADINYLTIKAKSLLKLKETKEAKSVLESVISSGVTSRYSKLAQVMLMIESNESGALKLLDSIVIEHPKFSDAILFKANQHYFDKNYEKALTSFQAHSNLMPKLSIIEMFIADTLIKLGRFNEALVKINKISATVTHPYPFSLSAIAHYELKNFESSKLNAEKSIEKGLDTLTMRTVAGLSALKLGKVEQAYNNLQIIKSQLAPNHPLLREIALIELKLNRAKDAHDTLSEIDSFSIEDSNLLLYTAFELIKNNEKADSEVLLKRVDNLNVNTPLELLKRGSLKMLVSDQGGLNDLRSAYDKSDDKSKVINSLIAGLLTHSEYEEATKYAKAYASINPTQSLNLQALILQSKGEHDASEKLFEQAYKNNNRNIPSLLNMAKYQLQRKNFTKANELINKAVLINGRDLDVLRLNYDIKSNLGLENEALELFSKLIEEPKVYPLHTLQYTLLLIREKEAQKVITLLETDAIKSELVGYDGYWQSLVDSYIWVGKPEKAIDTLNYWVKADPLNQFAWTKKILFEESSGNLNEALQSTYKAINNLPNLDSFKLMQINILLKLKNVNEAEKAFDLYFSKQSKTPFIAFLKGQIHFYKNEFDQASKLFGDAYSHMPDKKLASFLYRSKKLQGKSDEALAFLKTHLTLVPDDITAQMFMGNELLTTNQEAAIKHFLIAHDALPNNIFVLNNLAWLYLETDEETKALLYIEKALNINNKIPQVLDTAANILVKTGNINRAKALITKAFNLSNNDPAINASYEKILKL